MLVALLCILIFSSAFAEAQFCRVVELLWNFPVWPFREFHCWTEALPRGQVQCPPWLPTHPILTGSGQVSLSGRPHIPQVRVSNILFHKAIYSWCSETETDTAGDSEEGRPRKEPHGYYSLSLTTLLLSVSFCSCCVPQCPFILLAPSSLWSLLTKGLAGLGASYLSRLPPGA